VRAKSGVGSLLTCGKGERVKKWTVCTKFLSFSQKLPSGKNRPLGDTTPLI